MNRFVFFLCLSAFPCVLFGQNVSARVAGLENDQKYMELLGREQQLHRMEDSVVRIIGDTRELFSSHSSPDEREKYGAEILRLEKALYEIRNRIGVTDIPSDIVSDPEKFREAYRRERGGEL